MNSLSKYLIIFFIGIFSLKAEAQTILEEEAKKANDTISAEAKHSPKKATIMSALLPGLGQAYNKKYWKIPIIWGTFAGTIYGIQYNNQQYLEVKDIYKLYIEGDAETIATWGQGRTEFLKAAKNGYKRNRDLMFLLTLAVHALNIIDANVDAHLFNFDVSPDLSLKAEPVILNNFNYNAQSSFGLKFSIRF